MDDEVDDTIVVDDSVVGVLTVTLNRPHRMNALRACDAERLRAVVAGAGAGAEGVDCIVIRGANDTFCAGADFAEMLSPDRQVRSRVVAAWSDLLLSILRAHVPVVAAVTGYCVGGGNHLNLVSDVSLARSDALFKNSGADIGILPMEVGTYLLPLTMGWRRAKAFVLSAQQFGAEEAVDLGICAACADPDHFDELVAGWAETLAKGAAAASAKAMLNHLALAASAPLGLSTALGVAALDTAEARQRVRDQLATARSERS